MARARRDFEEHESVEENLAEHDLDPGVTIIEVFLTEDRRFQVKLGKRKETIDRVPGYYYGIVSGFPQLYQIQLAWGDVLTRLAVEPPLPKWYANRDSSEVTELNIMNGNPRKEETLILRFNHRDGEWFGKNTSNSGQERKVPPVLSEQLNVVASGPTSKKVITPLVEGGDFSPWGITDDSKAVEIRFTALSERGTRFTDGVLLTIGSATSDGNGYYARPETDDTHLPVLLLDARWVEAALGLDDKWAEVIVGDP